MRAWLVAFLVLIPSVASAGKLYVRLGVGPGVAIGTDEIGGADAGEPAVDVSTELAVGARVRPGLVVGVGEYSMAAPGPGLHLFSVGPFVEHGRGRLHLQAALTVGTGFHEARRGFDGAGGVGFGASAGVAYDVTRGARWSAGPLLRVTYYHWGGGDYEADQVSPSLLVAFTYRSQS